MTGSSTVWVLIPAYRPTRNILQTIDEASQSPTFAGVVVVDDGSGPEFAALFDEIKARDKVRLLRHAVNLGKGAALKTGLNHIACEDPDMAGVVTADADGQHATADILKIAGALADNPGSLILGSREFGRDVPLRSRFGNLVTRRVLRLVAGIKLRDTQTGLRGIPRDFALEILRIKAGGYEFELDMILACKTTGRPITEVPIQTIYIDDNASSHFDPVLDSMRIYFVFLRFLTSSLLAALVDNVVFIILYELGGGIIASQICGRTLGTTVNYIVNKNSVFQSRERHAIVLPRYLLLVVVSGLLSYMLILLFNSGLGMNVPLSKIVAETMLFFTNFIYQRDLVFQSKLTNEAR